MSAFFSELNFRDNKLLILGLIMCAYFTYHLFYGPRSFPYLQTVQHQNTFLNEELASLQAKQENLESRVIKLRPETLDTDLLKERARSMLGYTEEKEIIVIEE